MGIYANGEQSRTSHVQHEGAKYGNCMLKLYLEQGDVDPTLTDNHGLTPLRHAVKAGHEKAVKILLERWDINPICWINVVGHHYHRLSDWGVRAL